MHQIYKNIFQFVLASKMKKDKFDTFATKAK
jgi:hypothetical protein